MVGTRPNFPKAAPVVRAIERRDVAQILVHTEQHYDPALSDETMHDVGLREPDYRLGVGSGSHATQTARAMVRLEELIEKVSPAAVVVYGDVNTALAAALVAKKLLLPVVHVEAGLRSGDREMPEEINRVVVDAVADLLLATCQDGVDNLVSEGVAADKIKMVGNPMADSVLTMLGQAVCTPPEGPMYAVVTMHRPANVDSMPAAKATVAAIHHVADQMDVVAVMHPRGRERLDAAGLQRHERVRVSPPIRYAEFVHLVSTAALVLTDSGGIQEETTILGVPCLTLRTTTERPITVTQGTNRLITLANVRREAESVARGTSTRAVMRPALWDGHAGDRIADEILAYLRRTGTNLAAATRHMEPALR